MSWNIIHTYYGTNISNINDNFFGTIKSLQQKKYINIKYQD